MTKVEAFEKAYLRTKIPDFRPGDTVRVHVRVVEGDRERIQIYQGTVLKRQGNGVRETFTVRKLSFGVGVERTFLLHSPMLAKIEVKAHGHVRRAKLYYLRERIGKKARIREKMREGGLGEAELIGASEVAGGVPEVESESPEEAKVEEQLAEAVAEQVEETIQEEAVEQQVEPAAETAPAEESPAEEAPAEETPAEEASTEEKKEETPEGSES